MTLLSRGLDRALSRAAADVRSLTISAAVQSARLRRLQDDRQQVIGALNPDMTRLCIFSHFDPSGKVASYVRYHLECLVQAGFAVLFVSNSELEPDVLPLLRDIVDVVIIRRNIGHDYGAYRAGLSYATGALTSLRSLLFTNDSVYGPLWDLPDVLARQDTNESDVWSITDCWLHAFHLQSYWIRFSPRALHSAVFSDFWAKALPLNYKPAIVTRLEVELTQVLLASGLTCSASHSYRDLVDSFLEARQGTPTRHDKLDTRSRLSDAYDCELERRILMGVPLNPTHHLWRETLTAGSPYLKRTLFQDNQTLNPYLRNWRSEIEDAGSSYPFELIEEDQRRYLRDHVY